MHRASPPGLDIGVVRSWMVDAISAYYPRALARPRFLCPGYSGPDRYFGCIFGCPIQLVDATGLETAASGNIVGTHSRFGLIRLDYVPRSWVSCLDSSRSTWIREALECEARQ